MKQKTPRIASDCTTKGYLVKLKWLEFRKNLTLISKLGVYYLTMHTMTSEQITQEKIYQFLIEFRNDLSEFKYETNQRLSTLENRLTSFEERTERKLSRLEDKIDQLWESKDRMKLEFNRKVLLGNSFLAGLVAFFVAMFTGKYKPY